MTISARRGHVGESAAAGSPTSAPVAGRHHDACEMEEALWSASPLVLEAFDTDLRYVRASASLAPAGVGAPGLEGRRLAEVAPDRADALGPALRRVLDTGRPRSVVAPAAAPSPAGEPAPAAWHGTLLPVGPASGPTGVLAVWLPAPAAQLPAPVLTRVQRLQAVTEALAGPRPAEEAVEVALTHGVEAVEAVGAFVYLLGDDGVLRLAGTSDGLPPGGFDALAEIPPDAGLPAAEAARTGVPVWVGSAAERDARFPELASSVPVLHPALAVLPLVAGPRTLGALGLIFEVEREYPLLERSFLHTLASALAQSLARAELQRSERRLLARATAASTRLALLAAAGDVLHSSLDERETLAGLTRLVVPVLADWCVLHLREPDGTLTVVQAVHGDPRSQRVLAKVAGRYRLLVALEQAGPRKVVETGTTVHHPDIGPRDLDRLALDDDHRRLLDDLEMRSALIVPLRTAEGIVGALSLASASPRRYQPDDVALAEELAARAGDAVALDRFHRHAAQVADTLQRSLLPTRLPAVAGVELAAAHRAGGQDTVGGDWYTVCPLGGGAVVAGIGDVAGRGLAAAAVMGQLRAALQAYVLSDLSPGDALTQLARFAEQVPGHLMSTACLLRLDPVSGRLDWASAGHLPPLLLEGGDARWLETAADPPIGAGDGAATTTRSVTLPPGATAVLYTDGLVERRDVPLEETLAKLRRAAINAGAGLDDLPGHLMRTMLGDTDRVGCADDAAVLCMRRLPRGGAASAGYSTVP